MNDELKVFDTDTPPDRWYHLDEWEECEHKKTGTVSAGDWKTGPHASVRTCSYPPCIARASRTVHAATGIPANPMLTYEESRRLSLET